MFEVVSPSSILIDSRVKALEYQRTPGVLAYVMLAVDRPAVTVMRRSAGWELETVEDDLALPEAGIVVPLSAIYH